ncbi:hypothetical protein [Ammoniphilus sp. CFH 90114]|uniref:hypothetical protein n=1 Tax=Ammoniphilus sp. CFH 90114 TaxID=2493665 RepID=UPI0013E98AC9|nr:hypothetical protein [Ammoniphilus sp. CFH 90114]
MEADMSVVQVIDQIRNLKTTGGSLSKKKVKESHPQLMKNALYYFPSWEHAIQNVE